MSIEALLERIATNLERVADNQDRLIAGQAAAIEKVEATAPKRETKKEREAREKAEAEAAAAAEAPVEKVETAGNSAPAPTESGAADAGNATNDDNTTADQLKQTAQAWLGTTEDADEKKARAQWLQAMARSFTGDTDETKLIKLTGAESPLTVEHQKKAIFFIKRAHKLKGTEHVDFAAPYDFEGPQDQDAPRVETPATAEPEFDPLG